MNSCGVSLGAVMRLDWADVRRSRWLQMSLTLYGIIAVIFVLVGLRESAVYGFTGAGRVITSLAHSLLFLLPLLALVATVPIVNRSREDGTLELLFSHPLPKASYLGGITLTRLLALLIPFLATMLLVGVYGWIAHAQIIPWAYLLRTLLVVSCLIVTFSGIGLFISTVVRSPTRALVALLVIWLLGIALLDFALLGMMLQWRIPARLVFLLAALNPVQAARLALLSGVDPELSALGPVGFYLATQLGERWLFFLGLTWPLLVGFGAWGAALRHFCREDLV